MPEQLHILWGPVRCLLEEFTFGDMKAIVGTGGLDLTKVSHLQQAFKGGASKSQLAVAFDRIYGEFNSEKKQQFLTIVIEEIIRYKPAIVERLNDSLSRLGWSFLGGRLLPVEVIDQSDLDDAPEQAKKDLLKACTRLRDGDLSGAVSAACGAVDSITAKIYKDKKLGDPGLASFQEKVVKSIEATGSIRSIEEDLVGLGWSSDDAEKLKQNLRGSLNQIAYVMQKLRSDMGDVHGSKPTLKPLVFDCVKFATVLARLLKN